MVCHVRSASVSHRRRQRRFKSPPLLPPLAVLDLGKPAEREAHDFLCRATGKRDRLWRLLGMRRQGFTLLCVVRWVHPDDAAKPFSLLEMSLTKIAVCWRDYATVEVAHAELQRLCGVTSLPDV